jgi:probable F420-dependent oxidoreductase
MTLEGRPMPAALSPFAVWSGLDHLPIDEAVDYVRRVEAAGYGAFWTREGFGRDPFSLLARASVATTTLILGTSIANVHARDAAAMRSAAGTLHEITGGRFVLGLGVSHAPWVEGIRGHDYGSPVAVMSSFLAAYGAAPYRVATPFGEPRVVLAALRHRMVTLAGTASDGAFPYLVPERAIGSIRTSLDAAAAGAGRPRPLLIAAQVALVEEDPDRARAIATTYLRNYLALPAYVASLRALGYTDEDLAPDPSPRLIDELVLWGDAASIRDRLRRALVDGADQVAVVPLNPDGTVGNAAAFEAIAPG